MNEFREWQMPMSDTLQKQYVELLARHNLLELRMTTLEEQYTELQIHVKGIVERITELEEELDIDYEFDEDEYTCVSAA